MEATGPAQCGGGKGMGARGWHGAVEGMSWLWGSSPTRAVGWVRVASVPPLHLHAAPVGAGERGLGGAASTGTPRTDGVGSQAGGGHHADAGG